MQQTWTEEMRPSSVRDRILRRHRELRGLLDRLERAARTLLGGDLEQADGLHAIREEVCERLFDQIVLEDAILAPALRDADCWGDLRAERLSEQHCEQRAAIEWLAGHDEVDPRALQRVASELRDGLCRTESELLDAECLRDDVVGIGVNGG